MWHRAAAVGDGVVAVQNGIRPVRVVHVVLDPRRPTVARVEVLASGLTDLDDLSLITLVKGRPTFIAGAGWDLFDPTKPPNAGGHTVRIFQVNVPAN